jgi:hypothetical protein
LEQQSSKIIRNDPTSGDEPLKEFLSKYKIDYAEFMQNIEFACEVLHSELGIPMFTENGDGTVEVAAQTLMKIEAYVTDFSKAEYGWNDVKAKDENYTEEYQAKVIAGREDCRRDYDEFVCGSEFVESMMAYLAPRINLDYNSLEALIDRGISTETVGEAKAIEHNEEIDRVRWICQADWRLKSLYAIERLVTYVGLASDLLPDTTEYLQRMLDVNLPKLLDGNAEELVKTFEAVADNIASIVRTNMPNSGTRKSKGKVDKRYKKGKPIAELLRRQAAVLQEYIDIDDTLRRSQIAKALPDESSEMTMDADQPTESIEPKTEIIVPAKTESATVKLSSERSRDNQLTEFRTRLRDFNNHFRLSPVQINALRLRNLSDNLQNGCDTDGRSYLSEKQAERILLLIHRFNQIDYAKLRTELETFDSLHEMRQELQQNNRLNDNEPEIFDLYDTIYLMRFGYEPSNEPPPDPLMIWRHVVSSIAKCFPAARNGKGAEFPGLSTLKHIYELFDIKDGDSEWLSEEQLRQGAAWREPEPEPEPAVIIDPTELVVPHDKDRKMPDADKIADEPIQTSADIISAEVNDVSDTKTPTVLRTQRWRRIDWRLELERFDRGEADVFTDGSGHVKVDMNRILKLKKIAEENQGETSCVWSKSGRAAPFFVVKVEGTSDEIYVIESPVKGFAIIVTTRADVDRVLGQLNLKYTDEYGRQVEPSFEDKLYHIARRCRTMLYETGQDTYRRAHHRNNSLEEDVETAIRVLKLG